MLAEGTYPMTSRNIPLLENSKGFVVVQTVAGGYSIRNAYVSSRRSRSNLYDKDRLECSLDLG